MMKYSEDRLESGDVTKSVFAKYLKRLVVSALLVLTLMILHPQLQETAMGGDSGRMITGIVCDDEGAVSGAVVRMQTTPQSTVTDSEGKFKLAVAESVDRPINLTAWSKGYYIGGPIEASPGDSDIEISIQRHNDLDNTEYAWLPAQRSAGSGENQGCSGCHYRGENGSDFALPVDEWLEDAHSQSAVNPRFLTMYSGTDISGRSSLFTRYRNVRDYGIFPLPPDPEKPYYGPGYRLDNPDHKGNCASCHVPAAAVHAPYDTDPLTALGAEAEGVTCDFCHKIWNVHLDPVTGIPFPNRPGVLSYEFRRPFEEHQFFAGPLDDVAPGEDTYSELQKRSQFCAPCHFGVFWDTVVYDSFGEWLRSPYSREGTGKTCQDCHMPNSGAEYFAHLEKGGLKRDLSTIVSHRMPGARDLHLLQNAVSLRVEAENTPDGIKVRTEIVNDGTGHDVPTDSPLRHVILLVRAYGVDGAELFLKTGPVLPEWCGVGDPREGYYAGLAGKVYAKQLEEMWTKVSPTAAYWNPTRVVMDTRLGAFESDTNEFLFASPVSGDAQIEAVLLYRRAYKELMDIKGWNEPDIVMESVAVSTSNED